MLSVWNTRNISLTSQNAIIKSLPLFSLCVPPSFIFPLFKLSFDKCNHLLLKSNTAVLLLAAHLSPSLILFPSYSSSSPPLLLLPRSGSLLTLSCQCRKRERELCEFLILTDMGTEKVAWEWEHHCTHTSAHTHTHFLLYSPMFAVSLICSLSLLLPLVLFFIFKWFHRQG